MAGQQARCGCGAIVSVPALRTANATPDPLPDPFGDLGDLGAYMPQTPTAPQSSYAGGHSSSYAGAYSSPQASAVRPNIPRRKPSMPEAAKAACGGLVLGGVIWTIISGIALSAILSGHGDVVTKIITGYWACLAVGGYTSGFLIWQRVSFAKVPAAITAAAFSLFFPIGTLVGVFIFVKLFDKETQAYLSQAYLS